MTHDHLVWDFGRKVDLFATALLPARDGLLLVLWTDRDHLWSLLVEPDGDPAGECRRLTAVRAGKMAATDLGGTCRPAGARYLVAVAPELTVTDGPGDIGLLALDGQGRVVGRTELAGEAGPFSRGMSLTGGCDGVFASWHHGGLGEFESRTAFIDVRRMEVRWRRTLSERGVNGFCPTLLEHGGRLHAFWGRLRVRMRKPGEEDAPGRIMHAVLGTGGATPLDAHAVLETRRAQAAVSAIPHGEGMALLYRDKPVEELREGIYLALLDASGSLAQEPRRIARGDGPDAALLLPMGEDHLATAAVRSLANELLIGLNFLDERGRKRSGELQIYAHQIRFRKLAALPDREQLVLLYVEQGIDGTRLLMTRVVRVE
jgi:hypothetical protein